MHTKNKRFPALLIPSRKMILRANQNPCRDVAVLRLYIRIHISIQQRQISFIAPVFCALVQL